MNTVQFDSNHSILLKLIPPHFNRRYGVRQIFGLDGEETVLKYELEITYRKTVENQLRMFELARASEIYINDMLPDTVAEELAAEAGKVFYPLIVLVDFTGRVAAVSNIEEIQLRWKTVKQNLMEKFSGEELMRYLHATEQTLNSPLKIDQVMRKDLVLDGFFAGIYRSYQEEATERLIAFPLIGQSAAVGFMVKESVNQLLNVDGQIEIVREGVLHDERSAQDLIREDDFPLSEEEQGEFIPPKGQYEARYALNAVTKSIEAMELSWKLQLQQEEYFSITMYEISGADRITEEQMKGNLEKKEPEAASSTRISGFIKSIFG